LAAIAGRYDTSVIKRAGLAWCAPMLGHQDALSRRITGMPNNK